MEVKKRKSVAPFYAVAALWVVCGLAAPLYEPTHYVVLAAVSAAVFFAVNAICAGGGVIGAKAEEKKEEAKKEASTGNPELDKMLKEAKSENKKPVGIKVTTRSIDDDDDIITQFLKSLK